MSTDIVIVGAARTPIGDFLGALKDVSPVDLGSIAVQGALQQAGVPATAIFELACGMVYKAGVKGNPARQIQIKTGMPVEGYAYTVDQQCGSGMKAFELISQSIMSGKCDVGVAVGAESMSQAPYLLTRVREGMRMGDGELRDSLLHDALICAMQGYHMGLTAETLAKQYNISRQEQDELALLSHHRAANAIEQERFKTEIIPVAVALRQRTIEVATDEHPNNNLTLAKLAALKPAFKKDGTVTAGNSSSLNDGAAALVLMSAAKAKALGCKPLARLIATANVGVHPSVMGIGPAYAIPKVLGYAGLSIADIGRFEINEAFAAQFLAVNKELKLNMDIVNVNGSGVGLGHPVGCTAARLLVSLVHELQRNDIRYGVASLCVGGGPAIAAVVEKI